MTSFRFILRFRVRPWNEPWTEMEQIFMFPLLQTEPIVDVVLYNDIKKVFLWNIERNKLVKVDGFCVRSYVHIMKKTFE